MSSAEERITKMHMRAAEIERKINRRRSGVLGTVSGALLVGLVVVMQQIMKVQHGILSGNSTGSSMLSDSTGGYVLIAVIAFAAGTAITALIFRYRRKSDSKNSNKNSQ